MQGSHNFDSSFAGRCVSGLPSNWFDDISTRGLSVCTSLGTEKVHYCINNVVDPRGSTIPVAQHG